MKNATDVLTVGVFKEVLKEFGVSIEVMIDRKIDDKIDGLHAEMLHGFDGAQQESVKARAEMNDGFEEVRQEFKNVRTETARGLDKMRDDIIDVIDQNIQPQITSAVSRITRLERKAV